MRIVPGGLVLVAGSLSLAGCYPTLPPALAETPEVQRPGGVALTFVGGAAAFDADCCKHGAGEVSGGLETRVRVGVGAQQEVGGSVFTGIGTKVGNGDMPFAFGGKLTYKVAPLPWLALIADGGAMDEAAASVVIAGGDLAVVVAPYTAANGTTVYTGLRGSFAVPTLHGATDMNEALVLPVGLSLLAGSRARLFVEGGPLVGFARLTTDAAPKQPEDVTSLAGYGVVALSFPLR